VTKLLLLGGTSEARQIAAGLAASGVETTVSLAGATRDPAEYALPTRVGGFGGDDAFRIWLRENAITAVLDATHPFAGYVSDRTCRIAREEGLSYLQVLRPEWTPDAGDRWTMIGSEAEAARYIRPEDTIFLATGRQTLERFAGIEAAHVYCRQIDPPDRPFPFKSGSFVIGRPPFSIKAEVELFQRLGIDWLVVKNAGGTASRSKLDAARVLEIPVLMIRRPAPVDGPKVETVAEALAWVAGL